MTGLKALAHPLRVKIIDLISDLGEATASGMAKQLGESSASGLAKQLGESSGSTSYHLRQLARHGFLEEVPDRGAGRERWWRTPRDGWDAPAATAAELPKEASDIVTRAMVDGHTERLLRMLDEVGALSDPWTDAVGWRRSYCELTAVELSELRAEVYAVLDRYRGREAHPGSHRVSLEFIGFPIGVPDADAKDDSPDANPSPDAQSP